MSLCSPCANKRPFFSKEEPLPQFLSGMSLAFPNQFRTRKTSAGFPMAPQQRRTRQQTAFVRSKTAVHLNSSPFLQRTVERLRHGASATSFRVATSEKMLSTLSPYQTRCFSDDCEPSFAPEVERTLERSSPIHPSEVTKRKRPSFLGWRSSRNCGSLRFKK